MKSKSNNDISSKSDVEFCERNYERLKAIDRKKTSSSVSIPEENYQNLRHWRPRKSLPSADKERNIDYLETP